MSTIQPAHESTTKNSRAIDPESIARLFPDAEELVPLWIAEPYVDLAPGITAALKERADAAWYGYEVRPRTLIDSFWAWMSARHEWDGSHLETLISPSVGTSISVLIQELTGPGDGVLLQPPVYSGFKPLIRANDRKPVPNPLRLTADGYRMDLDDLEERAAEPTTRLMILCNPHNPVGRMWTREELTDLATICARHGVFVIADEIHADLTLPPFRFTPFASVAGEAGVSWAATHGPLKTFGLAGVCDTLLVTDDEDLSKLFRKRSSQLHLNRNNVFGMAAFEAGYRTGGDWLDEFLGLVASNVALLRDGLPAGVELVEPEGTYLAWLDFRELGMTAPELARWLGRSAHVALSPGHWFGREGAGFARMTIAAPRAWIEEAIEGLTHAVARVRGPLG